MKFESVIEFLLLMMLAAICAPAADAAPPDTSDIEVDVEIIGEVVRINSSFHVEVSPSEAWAVITDYDHASAFISDLEYSRIDARKDNALYVHQKGQAKHGPLSFAFESVREVRLTPFERLESHLIWGTMKKLDATTQLRAEGTGTRITDHRETIPGVWIPPILGHLFIKHEIRQNFGELRTEILRRKKATREK